MALRAVLLLLWLTACTPGLPGASCARNSDCANDHCTASLTCEVLDAAILDTPLDASTPIQPLPTDADAGSAGSAGSATVDAATADAPAADAAIDAR